MNRLDRLLAHVDLTRTGIEIAPYFNPAVPKSSGRDVRIVDVFPTEKLRELGAKDDYIPNERLSEIEEVDFVGDASSLGSLLDGSGLKGKVAWIVSSHNFEHLPNPIKFLQGCAEVLAPGGVLSMAIPDYRACFDHFRQPSRLIDWLEAHRQDRSQPSPATLLDARGFRSAYFHGAEKRVGCTLDIDDPRSFQLTGDLRAAYEMYLAETVNPGSYTDCHCNLMFGKHFEQLLWDLRGLGLVPFEVIEITHTHGLEFYAHLRRPAEIVAVPADEFNTHREHLLKAVAAELSEAHFQIVNGVTFFERPLRLRNGAQRAAAKILGKKVTGNILQWKRRRRSKRLAAKAASKAQL
jgi:predicted SAM-dependent methyltransferase